MTSLLSGIWLLDILNLLKYEGVDIFDSVVSIESGTWWCIWGLLIIIAVITGMLKYFAER